MQIILYDTPPTFNGFSPDSNIAQIRVRIWEVLTYELPDFDNLENQNLILEIVD